MIRVGSLCSGYGGIELGLQLAGVDHELVFVADPMPAAAAVLAAAWPDVPNLGDITEVDWHDQPRVDVLTMGFPCQDVSLAGQRAGMVEGSRSGLWWECRRAIHVLKPRVVLIENVRGLLSARAASDMEPCPTCVGDAEDPVSLRALGAVLGDLASIGYDARWTTLPASAVGAAHKRERVFVIAWPADATRPRLEVRGQGRPGGGSVPDAQGDGLGDSGSEGVGGLPAAAVAGGVPAGALLPTPKTSDTNGAGRHGTGGPDLRTAVTTLLPTPAAARSGRNRSASDGAAIRPSLDQVDVLLPSPRATDGAKGGPNQRGSSGDLMLPSAVQPERWGKYAAAIARWERVTGRPAPEPTVTNRNGNAALAPAFVEWLMGLPEGHVATHLKRTDALRVLGNGVVPHQFAAALRHLLAPVEGDPAWR